MSAILAKTKSREASLDNDVRGEFAAFLEQDLNTELLRFTTAGSVDDGKSTLIGRLLHDSKAVYEDQLASVKKSRINRSSGPIDFSLITDGLRAEREQGITIDVAYRYFATSRRKFIIADTPGHEQYTRNMATGASTSDLAVILIDATKGLLPQTRRHAFIASLLGISNVLAAVNKMDLVEYREDIFLQLQKDFLGLAQHLGIRAVQCIPISALEGDNVVEPGAHMLWYPGPTFLEHLETVPLRENDSLEGLRFPVQTVIRPDAAFRGFAGQLSNGSVRPGDSVLALPSGRTSRVHSIVTYDGELPQASSPLAVTLRLEDEIDLSRGDMLVSPDNPPCVSKTFRAMVVWFNEEPLQLGRTYLVKHTVRQTKIRALTIRHRVNINTLTHEAASQLRLNEIGAVEFQTHAPLFFDPYASNRITGSFILIDPISNATVGAGMIQEESAAEFSDVAATPGADGVDESLVGVTPRARHERHGHAPALFLLHGRTALAAQLERALFTQGFQVLHLSAPYVSPFALADTLRVTEMAGIVLIYSGEALDAETEWPISSEGTHRVFDLSAATLPRNENNQHEALHYLLGLAASLWLKKTQENPGTVN
ncbi:MAG TPA: sulfate adenylyltransferase subunit CysN [Candidatus Dormibacteraeota bacterium]|nr:sulfate adenylyltransferase subunit CysN [Candidatus Dormibacteraeota bacterium]